MLCKMTPELFGGNKGVSAGLRGESESSALHSVPPQLPLLCWSLADTAFRDALSTSLHGLDTRGLEAAICYSRIFSVLLLLFMKHNKMCGQSQRTVR